MNLPNKKNLRIILAIAILSVLFFLNFVSANKNSDKLRVSFFDVGQGDSIFIQTPNKKDILIDGGPNNAVIKKLGKAMPFWDKTIDLIIITHPHSDHISGLIEIIKKYEIKEIFYTGVLYNSETYAELLRQIKQNKIKLIEINQQQELTLDKNLKLKILFPNENLREKNIENLNNTSMVVKLIYDENSFLFAADAEYEVEQILLENNTDIKADLLKVGHQGASDSSSLKFLQKVSPQIAIISVGKNNKFGHPSLRVIRRLEKLGAKVFRSDQNGDIKIIANGKNYKILIEK
ncbi:MAG: ComEC/Rec2 family competence protein [Patescibacteria group bacterium]|nr:ComEC/Rec2 family competence protein [Patescibacteria group bacterium]